MLHFVDRLWQWRHYVSPKHWQFSARLQGLHWRKVQHVSLKECKIYTRLNVIHHKTLFFTVITKRSSRLMFCFLFSAVGLIENPQRDYEIYLTLPCVCCCHGYWSNLQALLQNFWRWFEPPRIFSYTWWLQFLNFCTIVTSKFLLLYVVVAMRRQLFSGLIDILNRHLCVTLYFSRVALCA